LEVTRAPEIREKHGAVHNRSQTIGIGAALIVRRGTGRCMTTEYRIGDTGHLELASECRANASPNGYCLRCAADDTTRHDRDARRKQIEMALHCAPRLGGQPRARRLKRAGLGAPEPKPSASRPVEPVPVDLPTNVCHLCEKPLQPPRVLRDDGRITHLACQRLEQHIIDDALDGQ